MRKKIKTKRASGSRALAAAPRFRPGDPLTPEQERNLRFRYGRLGSDGHTSVFRNDEQRAAAWREHRHRFLDATNPGTRCPAFWQYEPNVPDELREFPPETAYPTLEEAVAVHHCLARARRRWLLEHPKELRPGEAAQLKKYLKRLNQRRDL
jgi:hypothetical protein